jgi:hypothetical protein
MKAYIYQMLCINVHRNTFPNKKQENPKMSVKWLKGINKMWYIHAMEYYSAIKKKWHYDICYNRDQP